MLVPVTYGPHMLIKIIRDTQKLGFLVRTVRTVRTVRVRAQIDSKRAQHEVGDIVLLLRF